MTDRVERFRYENPSDSENEITVYPIAAGALSIAVADQKAMDSYNETIECQISLDLDAAKRLRDYLNEHFPD